MCGDCQYEPGSSKTTLLCSLSYKYIHVILSKLVTGKGDNTSVLSQLDLLYLFSMIQSEPIQLGYAVADYLHHYSQYLCVEELFVRPYIT